MKKVIIVESIVILVLTMSPFLAMYNFFRRVPYYIPTVSINEENRIIFEDYFKENNIKYEEVKKVGCFSAHLVEFRILYKNNKMVRLNVDKEKYAEQIDYIKKNGNYNDFITSLLIVIVSIIVSIGTIIYESRKKVYDEE